MIYTVFCLRDSFQDNPYFFLMLYTMYISVLGEENVEIL